MLYMLVMKRRMTVWVSSSTITSKVELIMMRWRRNFFERRGRNVLKSLKEKHDVPIPEFEFTELNAEVVVCKKRAALLVVEEFNLDKLLLDLPEEIGAVDVEKMDFRVALQMDFESALQSANDSYVETEERGEASTRAAEGEVEENQNVGADDSEEGRMGEGSEEI